MDETGINELRHLVSMAGWVRDHDYVFNGLTAEECVRLLRACRALDLETYPDELSDKERAYAARTGRIHRRTLARLYRKAYGPDFPRTGRDWEGARP